jgi:hypothetical protein
MVESLSSSPTKTFSEYIVDKQLAAYNEGNYGVFASCYHGEIISVDLYTMQMIPQMSGSHFFTHYRKKFIENPKIHCEVIQRIFHDDLVIDHEIISDYKNEQHTEMVIYQVEHGQISKMWFSREVPLSPHQKIGE